MPDEILLEIVWFCGKCHRRLEKRIPARETLTIFHYRLIVNTFIREAA